MYICLIYMTKKIYIFTIYIVFGLFFMPNAVFACGNKSKIDCCKKEIATKSEKKDCCGNTNSDKKNKSCGGKCGHSNCTTTASISYSILTNHDIHFINNHFDFCTEKSNFFPPKTFISKGFLTIWLPPVIS